MPIDTNILPTRGTYRGLTYSDRYTTLLDGDDFLSIDAETGRKSWYQGNAYTSYIGGGGLLNSSYLYGAINGATITCTPPLYERPVNISLSVADTSGTLRSGNTRASKVSPVPGYISGYSCPVVEFDMTKICFVLYGYIADIGGSPLDTDGWSTPTAVPMKTIMNDPTYSGIMENGYTSDGKFLLGWAPKFFLGTNGSRTYDSRVSIVIENAPPSRESWGAPENFYYFCNEFQKPSYKRISDIWNERYYDYSTYLFGAHCVTGTDVIFDGNGAIAAGELFTIDADNMSVGYDTIGDRIVYKKGRYTSFKYEWFTGYMTGEEVLRSAAGTGLYFIIDADKGENALIGSLTVDDDVYIGVRDADGNTTGDYVHGTAAANVPQAAWTNAISDAEEAGYSPLDPTSSIPTGGDPNTYDDENATVLPTPAYRAGNKIYAVNVGELGAVLDVISLEAEALETELETVQKFLTNNPIDAIAGALYYPFDVSSIITTEITQTEIILGNIPTGVNGYKVTNRVGVYNMGKCTYYPPDGLDDFRSYEPYSSAELYVPYCGSVKISPADYIGHEISVKYLIDIESGGCLALIYRDALAIDSIAGQIGVRIPISGVQTATLAAAQEQSQRNSINAKVATAAAIVGVGAAVFTAGTSLALTAAAVGGATALTAAATRLDATQYELEHQQIPYKTVGSAGAATSTCNEQSVRLVIHRPVMLDNYDAEIYGRTKGFACLITTTLSAVSGFTQVSNADLSGIPATEREKELILEALKDGTII